MPMDILISAGSLSSQSSGVVPVADANFFAVFQDGRRNPAKIKLRKADDISASFAISSWVFIIMYMYILTLCKTSIKNFAGF
jgi:hypothetical protein